MSAKSEDNKKRSVSLDSNKLGNIFQLHLPVFFARKKQCLHDGSNIVLYSLFLNVAFVSLFLQYLEITSMTQEGTSTTVYKTIVYISG